MKFKKFAKCDARSLPAAEPIVAATTEKQKQHDNNQDCGHQILQRIASDAALASEPHLGLGRLLTTLGIYLVPELADRKMLQVRPSRSSGTAPQAAAILLR
jgi:hypothetical protein